MNSTGIFTLALGLKEPWEITDIEISVDQDSIKELNIHLGFKRGAKFDDEAGVSCSVHDTQKRTWCHLIFFEHRCHLHCAVPRIRTSDGKVRLVQVPWARSWSGFTLLFEDLAMALIEREMPVNKIGQLRGENAHRIWTIFNHWIGLAYQADDPSGVTQLGFDETSRRKGHTYLTVAVDLKERWQHDALKGHKYTFLRNPENLSAHQQAALSDMITLYPTLGEAYRLKVLFNDLWEMPTQQTVKIFTEQGCREVEESKIHPFMHFAKTVKAHLSGIINYVETHITNAILESINNKIQRAKRRARGYRNTDNFINIDPLYFW